jgi:hypothetical protein
MRKTNSNRTAIATFKVAMQERTADGTVHELKQTAICETEKREKRALKTCHSFLTDIITSWI